MPVFYATKYQDKDGRWIYTQNQLQKTDGYKIIGWVLNRWRPHTIYYHLRTGGHVEAVKQHLQHPYFLKIDLQKFYNHISRGKIIRCLVKAGFKYSTAHDFAMRSTVRNPTKGANYVLPFGFVQSPLLATLVLQKSLLGRVLSELKGQRKVRVSVYMDDILLSSDSETALEKAKEMLIQAAEKSGFAINMTKSTPPVLTLEIFNIDVAQSNMKITEERMEDFARRVQENGIGNVSDGIIGYVGTVNPNQATLLAKKLVSEDSST